MNTTLSAESAQNSRPESDALVQRSLSAVIFSNLEPDCAEGPLFCLEQARNSIGHLMEFLTDHHQLPEAVALEFDAALGHLRLAEVHLRMAPGRCD